MTRNGGHRAVVVHRIRPARGQQLLKLLTK
jgi:hypothetical protein